MKNISAFLVFLFSIAVVQSCSSAKKATGSGNKTIIVDVRTEKEWIEDGHADCTVNYPLDGLNDKIDLLTKYDKVQVVCRSGKRSEAAKKILEDAGIKNVENKGSWKNIDCND